VASYLLRQKYIEPASIVDGDLKVTDSSRRNRNFKVSRERGPCYLLKQGLGRNGEATVRHESSVYQFLKYKMSNSKFYDHIPGYCGYDEREGILVLELFPDALDLGVYHARRGRFPVAIASRVGQALSSLHLQTRVGTGRGPASG